MRRGKGPLFHTSLAIGISLPPTSLDTLRSGHFKGLDIRIPKPQMSQSQKKELHISQPLKVMKLKVKKRSK